MSGEGLSAEEREALHEAMAAWAKVMPYNHLGPEYGLSDGIWTRLDRAVERILAARLADMSARLAAVEALADEAVARIGGTHTHWREGGAGGVCQTCENAHRTQREFSERLAALRTDPSETP